MYRGESIPTIASGTSDSEPGPGESEDADEASGFSAKTVRRLFAPRLSRFEAKEVIYNEGGVVDAMYFVRDGMVKLISHLPNGRVRIVRVHSAGSWLGLCGLLGEPYEHTAVAVDDVELYRIDAGKLKRLKSDNPQLYCRLIERWFYYLQEADIWIAAFSTGTIRARVARLINFLSDLEGETAGKEVKLLTCEEMAEIIGATPESVSRVLAQFKRNKVLLRAEAHGSQHTNSYHRNVTALDAITQEY